MTRTIIVCFALLCVSSRVLAQDESAIGAPFSREADDIKEKCFKGFSLGCATTLFTGEPIHIAAGTVAPQNGAGLGAALLWHVTPSEQWRAAGSADVVRAFHGAWRAGTYATFVRTALDNDHSHVCERLTPGREVLPVIGLHAQSTSLPQLTYFGIGPDTDRASKTFFGFEETIVGARGVCLLPDAGPVAALRLSLNGEANGRFVSVRAGPSGGVPSIEQRFTDATAPGLVSQPAFVQFSEGIRATPSVAGIVNFNYLLQYQQFSASSGASSFQRWTLDLRHEILVFGTAVPSAREHNDPNSCAISPTTRDCPPIKSRNRTGSVTLRALLSRSIVSGGNAVPFYFQRTIGGSDLDGNRVLASYEDYRFRGPHLLLFQETFEHSLGPHLPLGIWLAGDHGVVAAQNNPFDTGKMRNTFTAGLSFRAGGLPMALLTFAAGGPEGHQVALTLSPTLLGGSSRPSLQ